jgi:putative hydrolase of the HAD superfamily
VAPTAAEQPSPGTRLRAVSLDLDDTLWPVAPAIAAAERQLDAWLREHHAEVARRWPVDALRRLREAVAIERPDLAHDFTAQRLLTLERAFDACGCGREHVEAAYEVYFAARNGVECYPDALPALAAIAARLPLASISNGNADLARIGLRAHFRHCLSARECGVAKPAAAIFHQACTHLGAAPGDVLHVGDDPLLDVIGARLAGLRTAWVNRGGAEWSACIAAPRLREAVAALGRGADALAPPDIEVGDLGELARWIDRHLDAPGEAWPTRPYGSAAATAFPAGSSDRMLQ